MIERHVDHYGEAPRQAAFDGGFASQDNVVRIKDLGVKDVSFSKRCGISITDMVTSSWVYKRLRNFRAGVEGVISFFKRGAQEKVIAELKSGYAFGDIPSRTYTSNTRLFRTDLHPAHSRGGRHSHRS